jgi:cytochrome c553
MRQAVFALLATLAALPVAAPLAAAEGNAEEGRVKAYTCAGCHGIAGYRNAYPSYRVPKIYGQHREYLEAALLAYRNGERSHPTMRAQGESLTDQDIADLAAFLAGATAPAAQ